MRIVFHENTKVPIGFVKLLQKYGHKTFIWNNSTNAFDIFDLFEPDIVVISENDRSKSLDKCISDSNDEVMLFYSDEFYFYACPDIDISCLKSDLDIVYFGEYDPLFRDICLPNSNRNFIIFNSHQLRVPQEVGHISLEEFASLVDETVTLIDLEGNSDPEFTWLALSRKLKVISNNPRIPTNLRFSSKEDLIAAIQQEMVYPKINLETYKDRIITFFKRLKIQEEVSKIENQ